MLAAEECDKEREKKKEVSQEKQKGVSSAVQLETKYYSVRRDPSVKQEICSEENAYILFFLKLRLREFLAEG